MIRKIVFTLFLCAILGVVQLDAQAAQGSVTVRTEEDCFVSIYHVAAPEGMNYRLNESYGGGLLTFDDTLSSDLAAWLAGRAEGGITKCTGMKTVKFPDLEEGLYLIVQTGETMESKKFSPFFVCIPWDGSMWQIEVTPFPEESPRTGDGILSYLFLWVLSGIAMVVFKKVCWKQVIESSF